jgi:hypothetical protein
MLEQFARGDRRRFWKKVRIGSGCWEWKAARKGREPSYGCFWWRGKHRFAHRIALEMTLRRPLAGVVLHRCDNPICVRPSHLLEGTLSANAIDMTMKGRNGQHVHPERRPRGQAHGASKLSSDAVVDIRKEWAVCADCGVRL